jgi:hypothetical protein
MRNCFIDHPLKRILCGPTLDLRIAAAYIAVHSGKPHLLNVLSLTLSGIEWIRLIILRLGPAVDTEHATPLIDRDRLSEYFDVRIRFRIWQFLQARYVKSVWPRNDNGADSIPNSKLY